MGRVGGWLPGSVPRGHEAAGPAGACLCDHWAVLLHEEVDDPPCMAVLRGHPVDQVGGPGCDSVSDVGAPCTAGMLPSRPAW